MVRFHEQGRSLSTAMPLGRASMNRQNFSEAYSQEEDAKALRWGLA